jgi:hypothetical protein
MNKQQIEETINLFAARLKIHVQHPEDNVFHLDRFELYLPGYNTILDEKATSFLVFRGVTIPGQRTMPNGDPGYPDDYDVVEIGDYPSLISALEKIGHCIVTDWLDESAQYIDYMEREET